MNIVHIIDRYSKVNYGIWHAVTNTASVLKNQFGYTTHLVYPAQDDLEAVEGISAIELSGLGNLSMDKMLSDHSFTVSNTIFVTHGCWQYPTKWGAELKRRGYVWIYVPHGMLEPNSMGQKYLKKLIYFYAAERRMAQRADSVRAVSQPEMDRLAQHFGSVVHIPNAVSVVPHTNGNKDAATRQFLFMARIHVQKGVIELVQAWKRSKLASLAHTQLVIAGPDDGALIDLQSEIEGTSNVHYCGAKYGEAKDRLLRESDFFVLPSRAEGFPGSVIEAMSYGIVPIITAECNFPEALAAGCAFAIERKVDRMAEVLEQCMTLDEMNVQRLKTRCRGLIEDNYSLETVSTQFHQLYSSLLHGK